MEKRIEIEYHLDTSSVELTVEMENVLNEKCLDRVKNEYSSGMISGELIESFDEKTFYGWFWIKEFILAKEKAIEEIRLVSDKQIYWKEKPFAGNLLYCNYGKYCDFVEKETCIYAYLKAQ